MELTFANGTSKSFVVKGIFDPPTGGSPFGSVTMSAATWDAQTPQPRNLYSFVKMEGGETDANQAALDEALTDFPNAKAQDRQAFIDNQISGLSSILNILYVLLALSVIVSLFGIVNTLVLTVFERTREIGMLRAIGMTRRQVRRMIRHESVITALIGAALGIILGMVLAALLIARVDFLIFAFPTTQVIVFVIAAIVVGHRGRDLPGTPCREARSARRYRVRVDQAARAGGRRRPPRRLRRPRPRPRGATSRLKTLGTTYSWLELVALDRPRRSPRRPRASSRS